MFFSQKVSAKKIISFLLFFILLNGSHCAVHSKNTDTESTTLPRVYNATYYGLQQLDKTPLANRDLLILIHGISPESGEFDGWGNFIKVTRNQTDQAKTLNKHYKIYLFRYPPAKTLDTNSELLSEELISIIKK